SPSTPHPPSPTCRRRPPPNRNAHSTPHNQPHPAKQPHRSEERRVGKGSRSTRCPSRHRSCCRPRSTPSRSAYRCSRSSRPRRSSADSWPCQQPSPSTPHPPSPTCRRRPPPNRNAHSTPHNQPHPAKQPHGDRKSVV